MGKRGNESKGREGGDGPGAVACPSMINQPRLKLTPSSCTPQELSLSTCDCIQTIKIQKPNAGLAGWTVSTQQHPQKPRWPSQPWAGWHRPGTCVLSQERKILLVRMCKGRRTSSSCNPHHTAKVSCLGSH